MKAELTENGGCFSIELTAETMAEAATIARFGLNHTKEIRSLGSMVANEEFSLYVVFGKRQDYRNEIRRAK